MSESKNPRTFGSDEERERGSMKLAALCLALVMAQIGLTDCNRCSTTPRLRKAYTEHLGQLTSTSFNPIRQMGITGTDLGASFVEPTAGRLVFLFGDSWTTDPGRINQD